MVYPLDELESCQALFVIGICEPAENHLQVLLQEAKTHNDRPQPIVIGGTELGTGYPISPFLDSRYFLIEWKRYVAYTVTDESYSNYPKGEIFSGKNLRVFADSEYLRFLRKTTHASDSFPGPYQHYQIVSEMHTIDVAAEEAPEITILTKADVKSCVLAVCRIAFPREAI